jgi:hypothetical protein
MIRTEKRWLLTAHEYHYPHGGARDWIAVYDDEDAATARTKGEELVSSKRYDYFEIIDLWDWL